VSGATRVRPAAVAGAFYPGDAGRLAADVDAMLDAAAPWTGAPPKALVVPHAGYVFSGPIAASGYTALRAARGRVSRVVLLGPAHYLPVRGLAAPSVDAFATPLGDVPVDVEARRITLALPDVSIDDAAHAREHSLEVHLPFLQRVLGDGFAIVPFVVGSARAESVAAVLDELWGGDETLVVVSSDLSHYLDHDTAAARDRRTADAIVSGTLDRLAPDDACGAYPVRGLLVAAERHGLHTTAIDVRSSGDTAGPRDRVVGYGAFALAAA
jgi:AmmeMemoRadiSam system protein B